MTSFSHQNLLKLMGVVVTLAFAEPTNEVSATFHLWYCS